MNTNLTPMPLSSRRPVPASPQPARPFKALLAGLAVAAGLVSAQAQLQTAGTVYINLDTTGLAPGDLSGSWDVANTGTLGGVFEANTNTAIISTNNVTALYFSGTNYLQLKSGAGGSAVNAPAGVCGPNAICSIEVWAFNPGVTSDECLVSWGARNTGQNMALEYGSGGSGGVSHNGTGNDAGWDVYGGYPTPGYWHHLVYTSDGIRNYLYSDGVLVNSYPPSSVNVLTNGVLLGAQWNNTGTTVSTSPGWATLAIARLRVESGTLSAAQVLNNYNYEKAAFAPTQAPAYLSAGPVHRYSFNEPATNDATGLTFHDSVGTADGTVQADPGQFVAPRFTGQRLVFNGDIGTSLVGYGHAYGNLPGGMLSGNSTNNGGTGELSLEFWYKNVDGVAWSWSKLFDAGSVGSGTGPGYAVPGPGGYSGSYLDSFYVSAQQGGSVGQRQVGFRNMDSSPDNTTNSQININFYAVGNYQVDRHVAVTWKESNGLISVYDNGYLVGTNYTTNAISALNDINVWLGRSMNNDNGFGGEYQEVRFYNYALSAGQVLGDFQVGPNTINTAAQAANILAQPQSQSVNQGWPASLSVAAAGSPAVSYQWNLNGTPIPGATSDTYNIAAMSLAAAGTYTCIVSNNTGTPHAVTSAAAALTLVANVAPPPAILHETRSGNPSAALASQRDEYTGTVGEIFQVGAAGAQVTHLGMYDVYGDGLNRDHLVSLYSADGSKLIASAYVSNSASGWTGYLTNMYRYAALPTPVVLAPNTSYILQAEVFNGDGDMWSSTWQPGLWSPYFVGTNDRSTRNQRYGGLGAPALSGSGVNQCYGAPNLATLPVDIPVIAALQTGVTQYVNLSATLTVAANGQAPLTCQWYKAGSPDTALSGQTGSSLVFGSLKAADEGNYYAKVSDSLGTAQSANIYLRVLADTAVGISQQPTNTTVYQGFSAAFYVQANGTPPIGYQWYRNGSLLAGATNSSYTLATTYATNNNDVYSCVLSNFANASPHTLTSAGATLTLIPNQAPPAQVLYTPGNAVMRDNYSGSVGCSFQVGATPAVVTHLGYYCPGGYLNGPHHVGIYNSTGTTLLAEVFVSGSGDYIYNQYAYNALATPLTLAPNTTYFLAAEVYSSSGDAWPDVAPATWNTYYVGTNASTTIARYSPGNTAWPVFDGGGSVTGAAYGPGNLAMLPAGPPVITMAQTNQTQYATSNATFTAFVDGQLPVTVQWYKVGAPDTAVPGQTSATLMLNNLQLSDAGTYYAIANNSLGSAQGPNATLNVLPAGAPTITQQPQSQTVYVHQAVTFTVAASVPPQSYQWWFNNTAIPGATSSSYTVVNADSTVAGSYKATLVNGFGTSTSSTVTLTVLSPPAGSYAATVLQLTPLVYYPFDDLANSINTGSSNVFNMGSLGTANNGTVEGAAAAGPGPQPPIWTGFDSANPALVLDGVSTDVAIPALNLATNSGPNMTLAAWVSANGVQTNYAGILFHRPIGGSVASGLQATPDLTTGGNELVYHWANQYYGFESHLQVPTNGAWTFVALVIQPDQAVFYANSGSGMQSATNIATHAVVPFSSTSYVGWDDNGLGTHDTVSRRFNGLIDEPMIFDRSLSPTEIAQLYQASSAPVKLQISRANGQITLTWSSGVLQQASQINGSYSDVNGATSPYTFTPTGNAAFFRVRIP